jgi:hypothetical protein
MSKPSAEPIKKLTQWLSERGHITVSQKLVIADVSSAVKTDDG